MPETVAYMREELEEIAKHIQQFKDSVLITSLPSFLVYYAEREQSDDSNKKKSDDFYGTNCFWASKLHIKSYTCSETRKIAFYETKADVYKELIAKAAEQDKVLTVYLDGTCFPDGTEYLRYTFVDRTYKG